MPASILAAKNFRKRGRLSPVLLAAPDGKAYL
jgi:hypothetical protein